MSNSMFFWVALLILEIWPHTVGHETGKIYAEFVSGWHEVVK